MNELEAEATRLVKGAYVKQGLQSLGTRNQLLKVLLTHRKLPKEAKADIVANIAEETGLERAEALRAVEAFMNNIKASMADGKNVYLRGFGSFVVKERAQKTGRNISKNTTIIIPAHNIPSFKPSKTFVDEVKNNVKVK